MAGNPAEEHRDGRVGGRKDGRMERWKEGWEVERLDGMKDGRMGGSPELLSITPLAVQIPFFGFMTKP